MKITMSITNDLDGNEETYEVVCDSRDVRKYESIFETSWIETKLSITQMTQLAWVAARRLGKFNGDYSAFDAVNIDVTSKATTQGEVEDTNPT